MKRILTFLFAFAVMTFSQLAHAQDGTVYTVGSKTDTAKPNTTKHQIIAVGSHDRGVTLQYNLDQVTDTITGYVSVWGSLDGSTYFQYPGLDSVAISAATDVNKGWFVNTKINGNPVNYIDVRTRCPSNTTNATGKAKLNTKMLTY